MNSEWEEYSLGALIETVSVKHKFNKDQIILINTSDVSEGEILNHEYVKNENLKGQFKKSFKKGDILYSEIRPINKRFAYVDFDATDYVASTKLMVLRKKSDLITEQYLFQFLKSNDVIRKLQIIAESRSGTFPQITFNELSKLTIMLPPIEKQHIIEDLLFDIDDKVRTNSKIIECLEKTSMLLFKSWFVDFEFLDEDGNPYKSSGGKMIESELGEIPEGWKSSTIKDFSISMVNGGTPSRKKQSYWSNPTIPWVKTKEIKNTFILDAEEYISEEGLENSSAKLMNINNVLVAMYGATAGQLGILKIKAATNQACCAIETPYYAYLYEYLLRNQKYLASLSTGSAQQNLSKDIIANIKILVPEKNHLENFEEKVEEIYNLKESLLLENITLNNLRDTLLPKLLSGEIELPITEEE